MFRDYNFLIMFLLVTTSFIIYYLLSIKSDFYLKLLLSTFFIILCITLKLNVDISTIPDFHMYFNEIGSSQPLLFSTMFKEPYYYFCINYLHKYYSPLNSIKVFYNVNFLFSICFFIWVSFLKDISIWKKITMYSLYFYLFSFVLLRNTPSYILTGILFYYLHKNKFIKISYISFFAHISSLPILFFSLFKNKPVDRFLFIYLILYCFLLKLILTYSFFGISERFENYQNIMHTINWFNHLLYLVLFISLNVFIFFINKKVIYNYTYFFMFFTYLFLEFISPVLGFRFSIYMIFYLLLNPELKLTYKLDNKLNRLSPLAVLLLYYNYYLTFL